MAATIRTFLISTLVVLLGVLGNYWSNKYALQIPTIFYSVEKQKVMNKASVLITINNSSNIVIDSLHFDTKFKNIINIVFSSVKTKNQSADSTKWKGRLFPNETLKVLAFIKVTPNSDILKEIQKSLSAKYRNQKDYQWKEAELKNGTPGFKLFLTSIFWYALPFFIALIIFLLIWWIKTIIKKPKQKKKST